MGLGHWPGFGPSAWLGFGLLTWGLLVPLPLGHLVGGLLLASVVRLLVAHPWHLEFAQHYLPGGMAQAQRGYALYLLLLASPYVVFPALLTGICRRIRVPVWLWLPFAWWLAAASKDALTGLSYDDWLYSQWQVEPVLRAVGWLGSTPALLACLIVSAAGATALATRGKVPAAVSGLGLLAFGLMPPLPAGDPAVLKGVGAVHMAAVAQPPRAVPPGLALLVWPELSDYQQPKLAEGQGRGQFIEPPIPAPGLHHLDGIKTRGPGAPQNVMAALAPNGEVRGVRAKARLFPITETPFFGKRLAHAAAFQPGTVSPVLKIAGRRAGILLCLEAMDSRLATQARAQGATMLVISSLERGFADTALGRSQMLAVAVMRAAETGLPVVKASTSGEAAIISRQGRVLAQSAPNTTGVLTVDRDHLLPTPPTVHKAPAAGIAVLYSRATPTMQPALACDDGPRYPVEAPMPAGRRADTVLVSGDTVPPLYLGRSARSLAAAIAAFQPRLVVLDTCYGASLPAPAPGTRQLARAPLARRTRVDPASARTTAVTGLKNNRRAGQAGLRSAGSAEVQGKKRKYKLGAKLDAPPVQRL